MPTKDRWAISTEAAASPEPWAPLAWSLPPNANAGRLSPGTAEVTPVPEVLSRAGFEPADDRLRIRVGRELTRDDGVSLADPAVATVLAEARQAYIAVEAGGGPHVTPELFATTGDLIGFLVAASTLKARVLRRRPVLGITIRSGARSVVMSATATLLDPFRPWTLVSLGNLTVAGGLLPAYVLRNASDLAGFARDFGCGRLGLRLPERRVLVVARPDRLALVEGTSLVAAGGAWRNRFEAAPPSAVAPGGDAVVGWRTPDGPLSLPGRWDSTKACVQVPAALVTLAGGLAHGPACVVIDDYGGSGPAPKAGAVLRGKGTLVSTEDGAWVRLDTERVSVWRGTRTATIPLAAPGGPASRDGVETRGRSRT